MLELQVATLRLHSENCYGVPEKPKLSQLLLHAAPALRNDAEFDGRQLFRRLALLSARAQIHTSDYTQPEITTYTPAAIT